MTISAFFTDRHSRLRDPDWPPISTSSCGTLADIGAYATALAEDRRVNHHDDSPEAAWSKPRSTASGCRVEGDRVVLHPAGGAGNGTTRNAITSGHVLALSRWSLSTGRVRFFDLASPGAHRGRGPVVASGGLHAPHPDSRY